MGIFKNLKNSENISERRFFGQLLLTLEPVKRMSTKEWAETYRVMSNVESSMKGKFNCMRTPWMLYLMECLDNPNIPIIIGCKSAQIAWTETINNFIGKTIDTNPVKIMLAFSRGKSITKFYKQKWKPFYKNNSRLKKLINIGVPKESQDYFIFPGGDLSLVTLGAIGDQKSVSAPYQIVEEPDDVGTDVSGQGDSLSNFKERQKTFKRNRTKLIFGGTPTIEDFSRVDEAYKQGNQLVYKVPCHECGMLHELDFKNLKCDDYEKRYIDPIYGHRNPETAYYTCPFCLSIWTFEQKNKNVLEALKYGNLGWHALRPEIIDTYSFRFNELLSGFEASNFNLLMRDLIKAEIALEKGEEGLMKSFVNNKKGQAYASRITALNAEELKALRTNYPEGICPMEALDCTMGIDVQHNRFAFIIRGWGRNGNSWLIKWSEIFGEVTNQVFENGEFKGIWGELTDLVLTKIPHITGKQVNISGVSIDSSDLSELVYNWVNYMQQYSSVSVFATKGVRNLEKNTEDEIYREPSAISFIGEESYKKDRRTLAETMGVTVFNVGAHKAHEEVLRRINLNSNPNARNNVHYFNEQSYGQYEEQMTSCKKINISGKPIFKLIPGKRKEAADCEKLAYHAFIASYMRARTEEQWRKFEEYYYRS